MAGRDAELTLASSPHRVTAEHLQHLAEAFEPRQGTRHATLLAVPEEVEKEDVLPRLALERAGFDARQVDPIVREGLEHVVKNADLVADRKDGGRLVVSGRLRRVVRSDDDEAGRVEGQILDVLREDLEAV